MAKSKLNITTFIFPILLIVAFALRWAFAHLPPYLTASYEEASVGLMARHILQGDFIALWWGQPYGGTLETYLQSLFFLMFGSSIEIMRLVSCLIALCGLCGTYFLGRTLFNGKIALLAVLFLAVPPPKSNKIPLQDVTRHQPHTGFFIGSC